MPLEMFSTPRYRVTKRMFDDSARLVIAFDTWQQVPDIEKPCFGEVYLSSRKINHITVKSGQNTWYQDEEFAEIIQSMRVAGDGYRMIGYGSSMGAYAAISFYGELGLSDAVAFCPQYSIDSSKVPFETRWRQEAANLDFRHDFIASQPSIKKATVIYDPLHRLDSKHCGLITRDHPDIRLSRLPLCGHVPAEHLRTLGLLSEFTAALLNDRFDAPKHRERLRATRKSNKTYWLNMSSLNMRKRPKLALRAALNATQCENAGELEKMHYEKVLKVLGSEGKNLQQDPPPPHFKPIKATKLGKFTMSKISILLARQRSGTGALGAVLNQQQVIKNLGEVMHDHHLKENNNFFNFYMKQVAECSSQALPSARSQQLKDYFSFLEELYPKPERLVIDIKYRSMHHFNGFWHGPREMPRLIQMSREMGLGIIHLTRKNLIKTYVSGLLAEMNKVWHATPGTEINVNTIKLDCAKLLNYLNATRNEVEFVSGFLKNHPNLLHLEYEEIFDSHGTFNTEYEEKIIRFYELSEFKRMASPFVKQTSDQLQDVIENFEEVAKFLNGSSYSWMLE